MSHPTFWPGKLFFYAIGNTPPVCLTDHLPPEEDATILLLGCGDPRHIFYTIAVENASKRNTDITCCDLEPAIIARNVLLFTLVIDSVQTHKLLMYWEIFYDLFLDERSASLLRQQCDKLISLASDIVSWSSSRYGGTLNFVTEQSLAEARQHWLSYKTTLNLPKNQQEKLKETFRSAMKDNDYATHNPSNSIPLYSSVPAAFMHPESASCTTYWKTGVTSSRNNKHPRPLINPTFLFSLASQNFNLHYATDPCSSFHMALALISTINNSGSSDNIPAKTVDDMWAACRTQFSSWCREFHTKLQTSPQSQSQSQSQTLIIHFVVADALNFCQALRSYQNGILKTTIYKELWGGSKLHFHDNSTPKFFNIIDTSNLSDPLGLLNLLVAAQPLMQYSPCSVLHTNTLLSYNNRPTERSDVKGRAILDFPSITLLLGITPICFFFGFDFRNNTEAIVRGLEPNNLNNGRNYERMSWKFCDFICSDIKIPCDSLPHSQQLADKLFTVYLKMFEKDNPFSILNQLKKPPISTLRLSESHYNVQSFVRFVSTIKMNTRLETDWSTFGECLVDRITASHQQELAFCGINHQHLLAELHMQGVYTVPVLEFQSTQILTQSRPQLFGGWDFVPPIVYVVLIVPRAALSVLKVDHHTVLECETYSVSSGSQNKHPSIRPVFGQLRVIRESDGRELGTIQEDPQGFYGHSPLIVSFPVAAWILAQAPDVMVGLSLKRSLINSYEFVKKLGPEMHLFSMNLTNHNVHVFREPPDNKGELKEISRLSSSNRRPRIPSSNSIDTSKVSWKGDPGILVGWLCKRLNITDHEAKSCLSNKATVISNKQVGPCCILVSFDRFEYPLYFPVPVDHSRSRVRIARKSSYIEIELPFRTSPPIPMEQQVDVNVQQPFPLISRGPNAPSPFVCWNAPYLNLDRLFVTSPKDLSWATFHVSLATTTEKLECDKHRRLEESETLTKPVPSWKDMINMMFSENKGSAQIFPLVTTSTITSTHTPSSYSAIIFLDSIKIDLSSGTAIGDAVVVVPEPSNSMLLFNVLVSEPSTRLIECNEEVTNWWKYALPVFAERCRTWKHDTSTCEYYHNPPPPGSSTTPSTSTSPSSSNPFILHKALCSCGKGKNLGDRFMNNPKWKVLIPYVTRVAISTIFPVPYLEDVTLDSTGDVRKAFEVPPRDGIKTDSRTIDAGEVESFIRGDSDDLLNVCANLGKCRGSEKSKLFLCSGCKAKKYCSKECQKEDWKIHKVFCKALRERASGSVNVNK